MGTSSAQIEAIVAAVLEIKEKAAMVYALRDQELEEYKSSHPAPSHLKNPLSGHLAGKQENLKEMW